MSITSMEFAGWARRPSMSTERAIARESAQVQRRDARRVRRGRNTSFVRYCVVPGTNCGSWLSTLSTPIVLDWSTSALLPPSRRGWRRRNRVGRCEPVTRDFSKSSSAAVFAGASTVGSAGPVGGGGSAAESPRLAPCDDDRDTAES